MHKVAGVLIKHNEKYLLVQEKKAKAYGLWNLPAGHVDEGEDIKAAAQREGEEETGLNLQVGEEVYTGNDTYAEIHIFSAKVLGGELQWDKEELLDVKWFTPQEIAKLQLRFPPFGQLFV